MRKKLLSAVLMLSLVLAIPMSASANTYEGNPDWAVSFDGSKMSTNFKTSNMEDELEHIQPKDEAVFKIQLKNTHSKDTEWYMTNEIVRSMEESIKTQAGAAYGYHLSYTGDDGTTTTIYESNTLGGDNSQGLKEATDATKKYFYLGRIGAGKSGAVELRIAFDGETGKNAYQGAYADLTMQFAAEDAVTDKEVTENKTVTKEPTKRVKTVKTGDESNILLYISMAAFALGLILLLLVFRKFRDNEEEQTANGNRTVRRGRREDR